MKAYWKKVKLGEIYEVHNGLSKGGKFFGSGFPFLSFSTVFNNWFIPETIKDLVQSTEQEQEIFSVKKDDVFITRTSETADELGMSCVALKDYPNATYNGFCKRLRPIESDYKFLSKYEKFYEIVKMMNYIERNQLIQSIQIIRTKENSEDVLDENQIKQSTKKYIQK